MKQSAEKLLQYILAFFFWLALVAPLILYVLTFGWQLSSSHVRWAEFGSAMSGIYAPILSVFTIILLIVQLRMQARINTHEYDQAYIAQARADIDFYLFRLNDVMSDLLPTGNTIREVLHHQYQPASKSDLLEQRLREISLTVERSNPHLFSLWGAIYPILMGLRAGKTTPYDLNLQSATQKIIAMLSFETCVALDNFHYSRSEGRLRYEYQFSPLLRMD